MNPSAPSTRNVWLASYFLAARGGLVFVRATRLAGTAFRVAFFFADPDGEAPRLTKEFLEDAAVPVQRMISARRAMSEAMDVVREGGVCTPEDLGEALAALAIPSGRR